MLRESNFLTIRGFYNLPLDKNCSSRCQFWIKRAEFTTQKMQQSAIFSSYQTKLSAQRLPFWAIRWSQLTEFSTSLAYRSVLNQIRLPKFDLRYPSLTTTKTRSASWMSEIRTFLTFSREVASKGNSIRVT